MMIRLKLLYMDFLLSVPTKGSTVSAYHVLVSFLDSQPIPRKQNFVNQKL